jgi:hypothetical protein
MAPSTGSAVPSKHNSLRWLRVLAQLAVLWWVVRPARQIPHAEDAERVRLPPYPIDFEDTQPYAHGRNEFAFPAAAVITASRSGSQSLSLG